MEKYFGTRNGFQRGVARMRDRSQAERPAAAMTKSARTSTRSTGQTAGTRPSACVQIWRANSRLADLAPCPRFHVTLAPTMLRPTCHSLAVVPAQVAAESRPWLAAAAARQQRRQYHGTVAKRVAIAKNRKNRSSCKSRELQALRMPLSAPERGVQVLPGNTIELLTPSLVSRAALRGVAPVGRLHLTQAPVNLNVDATGEALQTPQSQTCHPHNPSPSDPAGQDIAACLRILCKQPSMLMSSTFVLNLAGLTAFDDKCMLILVELLHKYPRIVCINLGEKDKVGVTGWQALLTGLRAPASGVIAAWVDVVNAGEETVQAIRKAVYDRRKEREALAASLLREAELLGASNDGLGQLKVLRRATQIVPWRASHVWVKGELRRGVAEALAENF